MTSEQVPQAAPQQPGRRAWTRWMWLLAAAAVLLALSQVLWLWQTWPVRHLLELPAHAPAVAARP